MGFAPSGGAQPARVINLSLSVEEAFKEIQSAVGMAKGQLVSGQSGSSGRFNVGYKSVWYTLATTVRFNGEFSLRPSANGCTLSYSLKLDYNSIIGFVGVMLGCLVVATLLNGIQTAMITMIALAANTAFMLWRLNTKTAATLMDALDHHMLAARSTGSPQYVQPQVAPNAPVTQPSAQSDSVANVAQVSPLLSEQEQLVSRLKRIAELRDIGAITPDDFEAKKIELLARL